MVGASVRTCPGCGLVLSLLMLTSPLLAAKKSAPPPPPDPARVAARLLAEETISQGAWRKLQYLTDHIGHRLSGSAAAARAVEWGLGELKKDGLENVRPEKVMVPHWERGATSIEIISPAPQPLVVLTLGGSVGTPAEGVSGPLVEVSSLEELAALGSKVSGSIVLFNKQIVANGGPDTGYGAGAKLRGEGPSAAAKLGAVGSLIRTLGTANLRNPHTGATHYEEGVTKIPAAAIAAEDAELLHRLAAGGTAPVVRMKLGCQTLPDAESANVVGELIGREKPEEIVVIGAHLDSWDVGQGAIDDGAGVAMVLESLRLLKALDLRPRRTIRVVLFMNEENGLAGGKAYAETHKAELARHVAAIESDFGAGKPQGLSLSAGAGAETALARMLEPLRGLGASTVRPSPYTGADISPMKDSGLPLMGIDQDGTHYFDWHHSEADTLDKINPEELVSNVVTMAFAAWALAEAPQPLARRVPEPAVHP